MNHTGTSPRIYTGTFVALMTLLLLTIAAGYVDFGQLNLPIAMSISIGKTVLIILFFMHLRGGSRLTWVFAVAGFFWLLLLLGLAMSDYATRHWSPVNPF